MAKEESLMVQRIKEKMKEKPDSAKRQISLFLLPKQVEDLDEIVKEINETAYQKITRSGLIELAVDVLIEDANQVLKRRKSKQKEEDYDLAIFPSDETGEATLWEEKKWYYVRIDDKRLPKVKYIALYQGAPFSRIRYYAEVEKFESHPINGKRKYIIYIKGEPKALPNEVHLGNSNPMSTRSTKYTTLEKLKKAKVLADLNQEK